MELFDKLYKKFEEAEERYTTSKHTIDDIRIYRNACTRILRKIDKAGIVKNEKNFDRFARIHKEHDWAITQIEELLGIFKDR